MTSVFIRYLRLYGYFVRFSVSSTLQFRINFFFRVFMDAIYCAVLLGFYTILYTQVSSIGGWNEQQGRIFVGACLLLDALQMMFVASNINFLPEMVNKGDLDYYLVRPVSSLFFLSVREIGINSLLNVALALTVIGYGFMHYSGSISIAQLVIFFALILNGVFLFYIVHMLFVLPVFWTQAAQGLESLFYSLTYFMERPDRIFSGIMRKLLVTAAPFCLMVSFPSRILFEGIQSSVLMHVGIVTLALFGFLIFIWRLAVRNYSSASS